SAGRVGASAVRISVSCARAVAAADGVASRGAGPNRGCQSRWSWCACVAQPSSARRSRAVSRSAMPPSSSACQAGSTSRARLPSCTTVEVVHIVREVSTSTPGATSIGAVIRPASHVRAVRQCPARHRDGRARTSRCLLYASQNSLIMVLRTTSEVMNMTTQAPDANGSDVVIEMWADLACPWCYVSKHRLQEAIERRPDAERFTILMRSFQLDPDAPSEPETNEASYLRSHGGTADQLLAAERQMQAFARREGLDYAIDRM